MPNDDIGLEIETPYKAVTAEILAGVKGDKGDTGDTGDTGAQGPAGPTGPAGPSYTLPPSTINTLGGMIPGYGLTVDGAGKVSIVSDTGRIGLYQWRAEAFSGGLSTGQVVLNHDTPSSATEIIFRRAEFSTGLDKYSKVHLIKAGDEITIQGVTSTSSRIRFRVASGAQFLVILSENCVKFTVTFISQSGSEPADGSSVILEWNPGDTWATLPGKPSVFTPDTHTHDGLAPAGGSTDQVLKKVSGDDYDYEWAEGGGSGSATSGVFVDAADFGVVNHTSTDSRAALQAALDSIATSGGTVYLKGNTITNRINLTGPVFFNGANQKVQGAGKQATYIQTLGPAFVIGKEPKYWTSATSYVDTDTTETVACRNGSNEFILDGRYQEQITRFQTGGTYGAGASGQPPLEMSGVPGGYYGLRTRGVVKGHFPANPIATGYKKAGVSSMVGWEMQNTVTINLIYFAHSGKVAGGLCGMGSAGNPDPWLLTGDGTDFLFFLAFTTEKMTEKTQIFWTFPQPATTGLHRVTIQIDLDSNRLDAWVDRVKVATTAGAFPAAGYTTTLVANRFLAPFDRIALWEKADFTLGSSFWTVGQLRESGAQSDYTIVGMACYSTLMFSVAGALGDTGATLTRIDAATVTDGNTALPTSTVYNNAMACMCSTSPTGYDLRMFCGSLFTTWGMICPGGSGPSAATDVEISDLSILGQADQSNCVGIATLSVLRMRLTGLGFKTGFFSDIGGFELIVGYPWFISGCNFAAPGSAVHIAGCAYTFIENCDFGYVGRRGITSSGSYVSVRNALVNEFELNAEGFFAGFAGRNVGSGVRAENIMTNNEGERITPKVAIWRLSGSYYVSSNDMIFDRVEFGASPAIPAILIDMRFPEGQTYPGTVDVKNCSFPPTSPLLEIGGFSAKGYIDAPRTACQQEVVTIMPGSLVSTSSVITRHDDFGSVPNIGGWVAGSHEINLMRPAEGGIAQLTCATSGVEGSNNPPVWRPTIIAPSRNRHALSGNILPTLHMRIAAPHPEAGTVNLWGTHVNDSRCNLILQRVLTGSATFTRTSQRLTYGFAVAAMNAQNPAGAWTNSPIVNNDSGFWGSASGGQKASLATLTMTHTGTSLPFDQLLRVRAGVFYDIGNGSSTNFLTGKTNFTTPNFLNASGYTIAIGGIVVANSTREGSWCHAMQNMVLDYVFGNGSPSIPSTFYFGLSTTAIAADGTGITEPSGGSYARVSATANSTNFGALDEYKSTWTNKTAITFPSPTGDWGTIRYGFISDASSGGNILAKWPVNQVVKVLNGEDAPSYAAGAIHFQI